MATLTKKPAIIRPAAVKSAPSKAVKGKTKPAPKASTKGMKAKITVEVFIKKGDSSPKRRDFNAETTKVLLESKAGKNLLGPYATTKEMFEDFGV
jgi:hypothetical protein